MVNSNDNTKIWDGSSQKNGSENIGFSNNGGQSNYQTAKSGTQTINQTSQGQDLKTLKEETARELNINLDSPQLTAREAGAVGGSMVRKMINEAKSRMPGGIARNQGDNNNGGSQK